MYEKLIGNLVLCEKMRTMSKRANKLLAFDFSSIERVLIRKSHGNKQYAFFFSRQNRSHLCINTNAIVAHDPQSIRAQWMLTAAQSKHKQEQQFPNLIRQFIESNKTLNNCFYAVTSTTQNMMKENKRKQTIRFCRCVFFVFYRRIKINIIYAPECVAPFAPFHCNGAKY